MAEPYLGEIRIFARNQVPSGWAFCDGALLPVAQAGKVFELIGNTYGGDGRTTFALPDLRGRAAVGEFAGATRGAKGGEATHQLTMSEMPAESHTHQLMGSSAAASTPLAAGNVLAGATLNVYADAATPVTLAPRTVAASGGPHENMAPYLALTFCIAMSGVWPDRD